MLPIRRFTKKPSGSQQKVCRKRKNLFLTTYISCKSIYFRSEWAEDEHKATKLKDRITDWEGPCFSLSNTCQSETLPGMRPHSPSKSYVSETKHFLLTCKQTNKILIWQLWNSLIFHSSQTAKRSDNWSYLWAKCTSLLTAPHILLRPRKVLRKLFLFGKKKIILLFCFFFLVLVWMPNYSVCCIVFKYQLAHDDWHWSFLRKGPCSQFLGAS